MYKLAKFKDHSVILTCFLATILRPFGLKIEDSGLEIHQVICHPVVFKLIRIGYYKCDFYGDSKKII